MKRTFRGNTGERMPKENDRIGSTDENASDERRLLETNPDDAAEMVNDVSPSRRTSRELSSLSKKQDNLDEDSSDLDVDRKLRASSLKRTDEDSSSCHSDSDVAKIAMIQKRIPWQSKDRRSSSTSSSITRRQKRVLNNDDRDRSPNVCPSSKRFRHGTSSSITHSEIIIGSPKGQGERKTSAKFSLHRGQSLSLKQAPLDGSAPMTVASATSSSSSLSSSSSTRSEEVHSQLREISVEPAPKKAKFRKHHMEKMPAAAESKSNSKRSEYDNVGTCDALIDRKDNQRSTEGSMLSRSSSGNGARGSGHEGISEPRHSRSTSSSARRCQRTERNMRNRSSLALTSISSQQHDRTRAKKPPPDRTKEDVVDHVTMSECKMQTDQSSLDKGENEHLAGASKTKKRQRTSRGEKLSRNLSKPYPKSSTIKAIVPQERQRGGESNQSIAKSQEVQGESSYTPRMSHADLLSSMMLPLNIPLAASGSTTGISQSLGQHTVPIQRQFHPLASSSVFSPYIGTQQLEQHSIPFLLQHQQLGSIAMMEHSDRLRMLTSNSFHADTAHIPNQHLHSNLAAAWMMYPALRSSIQHGRSAPPWMDGRDSSFAAFQNFLAGASGNALFPEAIPSQTDHLRPRLSLGSLDHGTDVLSSHLIARERSEINELLGSMTADRNSEHAEANTHDFALNPRNSQTLDAHRGVQEIHIPATYQPRGIRPLSLEPDSECLSPYQCFVRQQILLFEAQQEEIECGVQGRSRTIATGQVGILCRHCAHVTPQSRRRGAMYFPFKIMSMYQAAQNMVANHLLTTCPNVPVDTQRRLKTLKEEPSSMVYDGKLYWANAARTMGIDECEFGLRFRKHDHP